MELNSFLFPAPQSSYSIHGSIGDVIYIPRKFERKDPAEVLDDSKELDFCQDLNSATPLERHHHSVF